MFSESFSIQGYDHFKIQTFKEIIFTFSGVFELKIIKQIFLKLFM